MIILETDRLFLRNVMVKTQLKCMIIAIIHFVQNISVGKRKT